MIQEQLRIRGARQAPVVIMTRFSYKVANAAVAGLAP